jgi:GAF domain-containing protein
MTFETQHQAKSGRIFDVDVSASYFQFDGLEYCCSSVRDITERKQTEHILRLQHEVLAKVASTSAALSETLHALCLMVEELVPGCVATVMLVDPSDGCLRFEAGPSLTDKIRQAFEPLAPGFESGSCGAAALLKRPVFVQDTRTSPHWEKLQHIVEQFNLLACWSLPILDERNQTLGTFAISHLRATSPSDFHRQILETGSHMASIAIRRTRFEQQLQIAHEELAHVSRLSTIGELASNIAH